MDNRQELIDYLPEHLKKFKEFQEINRVLQDVIDSIAGSADTLVNNCYINECDANSIAHYERIYSITPEPTDTLEQRKNRIIQKLSFSPRNNIDNLYARVAEFCGDDEYSISYEPQKNNLTIATSFEDSSRYVEFCEYIESTLPMNMYYEVSNDFERTLSVDNGVRNTIISKKVKRVESEVL